MFRRGAVWMVVVMTVLVAAAVGVGNVPRAAAAGVLYVAPAGDDANSQISRSRLIENNVGGMNAKN